MPNLWLRSRRSASRDDGFSLVELLVIVVILGIVGSIVSASIISALQTTRRGQERVAALGDVQKGIERVGRELRAADPLILDAGLDFENKIAAQVRRSGEVRIYTYYIFDTGTSYELREDVERFDLASGTLISTTNGLFIADIANPVTGTPMFRYFRQDGTEIDCVGLDLTVASDRDECIARHSTAAQVHMSLEKVLDEQDPIGIETVINVRNTRYSP